MENSSESNLETMIWKKISSHSVDLSYGLFIGEQKLAMITISGYAEIATLGALYANPDAYCEFGQMRLRFIGMKTSGYAIAVVNADTGEQIATITTFNNKYYMATLYFPSQGKYVATVNKPLNAYIQSIDGIERTVCTIRRRMFRQEWDCWQSDIRSADPDPILLWILCFYMMMKIK